MDSFMLTVLHGSHKGVVVKMGAEARVVVVVVATRTKAKESLLDNQILGLDPSNKNDYQARRDLK